MKAEGEEEVGGVEGVEEVGGSDDVLIFAMSVCPPPRQLCVTLVYMEK
jgi:hypothetical protein